MSSKDIIKKLTEYIPGFKREIKEIKLDLIESNPFNPRKKFGQEEEDELIESIGSKGVLQPVIVFERKGKYVLLDGQRRVQACQKLGIQKIPAHIVVKEPTFIENVSIMFHIHNVHEDWTDLAIAKALEQIVRELGINRNKPTAEDIKNIQKLTSLSKYKITKFLDVLKFSKQVIDKFMESELKEKPDLDVDLLTELRTPLKKINKAMPNLAKKYSEEDFVDIFVHKKMDKVITTNKQIRKISKIISNANRGKVDKKVAEEKISYFLENKNVSVEEIYSDTSESIEQAKSIIKVSTSLRREISNIDLRKLTVDDKSKLVDELAELKETVIKKIERD